MTDLEALKLVLDLASDSVLAPTLEEEKARTQLYKLVESLKNKSEEEAAYETLARLGIWHIAEVSAEEFLAERCDEGGMVEPPIEAVRQAIAEVGSKTALSKFEGDVIDGIKNDFYDHVTQALKATS